MIYEKILKLLSLCLKAKEQGNDIFFHYSPHVNSISIFKFQDGATFEDSEKLVRDIYITIYTERNETEVMKQFEDAEKTIEELIVNKIESC